MKITLVHRFFWPDTPPYAVMLRHIAGCLAKDKHDVTVISTQPSYKNNYVIEQQPWIEKIDGFTVKRLKLKAENKSSFISRIVGMLTFTFKLFIQLLKEKPDTVMIATTPPLIGGLAVRYACKIVGAKYIYHCQDIYPEVALVSGHLKNKYLLSLLKRIDKKTCDNAVATVVLSQDMKQSLIERGCHGKNIHIINNFELVPFLDKNQTAEKQNNNIPIDMIRPKGIFRVLFAGNIGRFQGLESIIETAHYLHKHDSVEFVFLGEGVSKLPLEDMAGENLGKTIKFFGHQPIEIARALIADSQLCLITLNEGIYKYAYPSKTMTYMCEGIPVAVMAELTSELSESVIINNLGIAVKQGDAKKLANLIEDLYKNNERLEEIRKNVSDFSRINFSMQYVLPKWVSLFKNHKTK
ncbi:glycosyltransferase family 4 protein [uncultured Cocleimonas sp.]|uniref:glycosyltransferase family 4 protein n=1 Tax=uncultured Cocleimonas sp. TaxID=1051587 RepID=UPI002606DCE5|nr:glycosyltransferase family 4 protein [uncultured Cocleimonas sp.]